MYVYTFCWARNPPTLGIAGGESQCLGKIPFLLVCMKPRLPRQLRAWTE